MPQNSTRHFVFLDGLRGIAAFLVVVYHLGEETGLPLAKSGYLAVDFFFTLSGFVIAQAYSTRLKSDMRWRDFVIRRLKRLYPLYALSLLLSVAYVFLLEAFKLPHVNRQMALETLLFSLAFLPTPLLFSTGTFGVFPLNVPAWSLSLEIGINLLYARLVGVRNRYWLPTALIIGFISVSLTVSFASGINSGSDWATYGGGWARVFWSFFAGVSIQALYHRPNLATWMPLPDWLLYSVMTIALVAILCCELSPIYELTVVVGIFPTLVFCGARISQPRGQIKRWMELCGALSYPLYITHFVFLQFLNLALTRNYEAMPWSMLALKAGAAIGCAAVCYYWYDVPVRRWLAMRSNG